MVASGDCSNGTLPTSKTSSAMTRIDRNSTNMQIYAYEIKQSVSKNFFLLLRTTPRLTALRTVYFPAMTRNGFCFHIWKIISRRPWPPPKNRDIHIVEFFLDSIYSKTIDIIRKQIYFFLFLNIRPMCTSGPPAHGSNCRYRSIRAADRRSEFAGSVLAGPPAHGTMLHKIYSRTPGSRQSKS